MRSMSWPARPAPYARSPTISMSIRRPCCAAAGPPRPGTSYEAAQFRTQAQGSAPPPQVAEPRAKTTLFARGALGRAGARVQRFILLRGHLLHPTAPERQQRRHQRRADEDPDQAERLDPAQDGEQRPEERQLRAFADDDGTYEVIGDEENHGARHGDDDRGRDG